MFLGRIRLKKQQQTYIREKSNITLSWTYYCFFCPMTLIITTSGIPNKTSLVGPNPRWETQSYLSLGFILIALYGTLNHNGHSSDHNLYPTPAMTGADLAHD